MMLLMIDVPLAFVMVPKRQLQHPFHLMLPSLVQHESGLGQRQHYHTHSSHNNKRRRPTATKIRHQTSLSLFPSSPSETTILLSDVVASVVTADKSIHSSFDWATSTLLLSHAAVDTAAASTSTSGIIPILPVVGSSCIMLTIVGLLYLWETSVEYVRETIPKALKPVIESILGEIGGLGFIGLIVQTVIGGALPLEELSIQLFGEKELLLETFEFLHTAFFQVGIGFFVAAGTMVYVGIQKLQEIESVENLQRDITTGTCSVTPEKLTQYLPVMNITATTTADDESFTTTTAANDDENNKNKDLFSEIFMSKEERAGKTLLLRNRLLEQHPNILSADSFSIEKYIENSFATNLLELVELSPLTWIYLIPALALANSVDLSHDVVNSSSPNALESVGYFFSTPWVLYSSIVTVALSIIWGIWNCWKVTQIKYMLLPRLGRQQDTDTGGEVIVILPPPIDNDQEREKFVTTTVSLTPFWVQPLESIWSEPAKTNYGQLFGTAGAAGPELYRSSIQYQTWLCITNIVFFGSQIVSRDIEAIFTGAPVGDPVNLIPEFVTYGSFVLLSLIQLIFFSPRAFWNLCLIDCAEDGASEEVLNRAVFD